MAKTFENVNPKAVRKMVAEVSNTHTLMWVAVAAVVHLLIMGATSYSYVRDRWIDPQGAATRAQAAAAVQEQQAAAIPAATATQVQPQPQPSPKPATAADDEKALLEKKKDNPEVKKITEAAKPGEIPKTPTHEGFNLDDSLK